MTKKLFNQADPLHHGSVKVQKLLDNVLSTLEKMKGGLDESLKQISDEEITID